MTFDPSVLLLAHAMSTLIMVGILWFVQVVHYPMFALVGEREFPAWQSRNTQRTSFVVGPPMLVEMATTIGLVAWQADALTLAGLLLLAACWTSTALLQVPAHNRLERAFDVDVHRRLVRTNWIRTVCWSARGVLALALLDRF